MKEGRRITSARPGVGKAEWLLNMVHYNAYQFEVKMQYWIGYPILCLIRTRRVRERIQRKSGIDDYENHLLNTLNGPTGGLSIMFAGGHLVVLVFLLFIGLATAIHKLSGVDMIYSKLHFIALGLIAYIPCHFLVFQRNRYLEHFKEFRRMSSKRKILWAWITVFLTLGTYAFGIGSILL